MRVRIAATLLFTTSFATIAAIGLPAEEPKVRDLTGTEVSSEDLIEALKPTTEAPRTRGGPGPRSLGIGGPPKCDFYRRQLSRGLTVKPAADPVALTVHFEFNSAAISPSAEKILRAIGDALRSSTLAPCCFQLEGHTDSVGSDEYNDELSRRRAESVARYLTEEFDIDSGRLLAMGLGEAQPIDTNETDEGRQKNRRVQLVNLGYGSVEQ
jgi:outer membrane protein OmpA-like peptidoglycan-associated protein